MLRRLLQERFRLQVTQEKRDQPVYILKEARGGTKIRPLPEESCVSYDPEKPLALELGQPQPKWCGGTSFGPSQLKDTAITAAELVRLLEQVSEVILPGI
jgi:uncharacterized protein (TIGR03435 family)